VIREELHCRHQGTAAQAGHPGIAPETPSKANENASESGPGSPPPALAPGPAATRAFWDWARALHATPTQRAVLRPPLQHSDPQARVRRPWPRLRLLFTSRRNGSFGAAGNQGPQPSPSKLGNPGPRSLAVDAGHQRAPLQHRRRHPGTERSQTHDRRRMGDPL